MIAPITVHTKLELPRLLKIRVIVPEELIKIRAYENFLLRDKAHGSDLEDWFNAEQDLQRIFEEVSWSIVHDGGANLSLRAMGTPQVLELLSRYLHRCPGAEVPIDGRSIPLRIYHPDGGPEVPIMNPQNLESLETSEASQDLLDQAKAHGSPLSFLTEEEFGQLHGQLIALLIDGSDKGKVIAKAPLNQDHPDVARMSIKTQVAQSRYRNRRYQLRQVLERNQSE